MTKAELATVHEDLDSVERAIGDRMQEIHCTVGALSALWVAHALNVKERNRLNELIFQADFSTPEQKIKFVRTMGQQE